MDLLIHVRGRRNGGSRRGTGVANKKGRDSPVKSEPATRFNAMGQSQTAKGIVQRVDTVQREVTILMPNGLQLFDVPTDCPIVLHGERIKLRMIQPRDHVNIRFAAGNERPIASFLEVQPARGVSCFRL